MKFVFLELGFFEKYPGLVEVEKKYTRPYSLAIVEIEIEDDMGKKVELKFAIPLRSKISHKYFLSSLNSTNNEIKNNLNGMKGNKGIDYSKAILIIDDKDLSTKENIKISDEEYNNLKKKKHKIKEGMEKYIKAYKKAYKKKHIKANEILCKYSTLQNYHEYIGIK